MSGVLAPPANGVSPWLFRVLINHTPLAGGKSCTVTHNNHYRADTFSVELAVAADAGSQAANGWDNAQADGGSLFDDNWWSDQDDVILAEIQFAQPQPGQPTSSIQWQTEIIGEVEDIEHTPERGLIRISGHDLSQRLIRAKTQEGFVNQTSSQIATTLALRRGLTPNVQATSTPVGQYYQLEHDRLALGSLHRATTEWNLLTWLAEQEGFDVWVSGQTLNFQPNMQAILPPLVVQYQPPTGQRAYPISPVQGLKLSRTTALAKGVIVKVLSWQSRNRNPTIQTAGVGGKDTQTYTFIRPNLTPAAAQTYANNMLEQITRHERRVEFRMPAELAVTIRNQVFLTGTGTAYDQVYWITSFSRSMSVDGGFWEDFRLRNHSPQSEPAVE